MASMYFIQYEVRPSPRHEDFESVGGAFANCFVLAESADQAQELAMRNFSENHWEVTAVEEPPLVTSRSEYSGDWLDWYDQATHEGECYVFHQWPNEPQEGNLVQ